MVAFPCVLVRSFDIIAGRGVICHSAGMRRLWPFLLLLSALFACAKERLQLIRPMQYSGMADASGAVAINSNLFLAVSDEDNIVRLYSNDRASGPLKQFDFNDFLQVEGKSPEADLEAGTRMGNRAFWIGSHGRNRNGKDRQNRCRLFATDIEVKGDDVILTPIGKPYKNLLDDLIRDPRFSKFEFAQAAGHAPKESGALNIEGLAATPEGHLLIGFRNPIPQGKALLIPLLNPNEVIAGKSPLFDSAIQLDLGGLGVRDITCYDGTYFIIAGSSHSGGKSRLYRWPGPGANPELLSVDRSLKQYNPEALLIYPGKGSAEIQMLSDDGNRPIDGIPGKEIRDPRRKTFRSFWVVK